MEIGKLMPQCVIPHPMATSRSCVRQVQKPVGKYLHDLKKDKTLTEKHGKRPVFNRCLTHANINKLQSYYGNAIRASVGNVESIKKTCWALFYHSSSRDKNPKHDCCRHDKGACSPYNRALAQNVGQSILTLHEFLQIWEVF